MPLISITSPKGGVGKTTLAANVAFEISRLGNRVLALDIDPQNALRLHFGLALSDRSGLMPALLAHGRWQPAVRETGYGVLVLPYGEAAPANSNERATIASDVATISRILQDILSDSTMTIVLDTPPGPSLALSSILPLTDVLVTVLLADAASAALIPVVEQGRFYRPAGGASWESRHGYVLNQLNPVSRLSRITGEAVRRHIADRLVGTITRDEHVAEALASQQPIATFAPTSRAAQDIATISKSLARQLRDQPV
jgi:cellulose synthase operon protein YhjQ